MVLGCEVLLPALAMLQPEWTGEIEQLSWKPRAYLMRHFLSDAECDHIVGLVSRTKSPGGAAHIQLLQPLSKENGSSIVAAQLGLTSSSTCRQMQVVTGC